MSVRVKLADKIIDIIKGWTKADKEAQLEGVTRLGLPANNTAADRAKALGFRDEQFFHGTKKVFDEFDPNKKMRASLKEWDAMKHVDGHDSLNAISVTKDPGTASSYAGVAPDGFKFHGNGGMLMPLKVRGNLFDYRNPEHLKDIPKRYRDRVAKGSFQTMEPKNIQNIIREAGYDGYKSHADLPIRGKKNNNKSTRKEKPDYIGESKKGKTQWKSTMHQIYDPTNIRSQHAHFNPKYLGVGAGSILSADLMADELDLEYKGLLNE